MKDRRRAHRRSSGSGKNGKGVMHDKKRRRKGSWVTIIETQNIDRMKGVPIYIYIYINHYIYYKSRLLCRIGPVLLGHGEYHCVRLEKPAKI